MSSAILLIASTGCDRSPKPLAVYDDTEVGPEEILAELDFLLPEDRPFSSLDMTHEEFLRQYVRVQLLLQEARRSFQGLSPADQSRFSLYQEALVRDAIVDEVFEAEPPPDEARIRAAYEARADMERELGYIRAQTRDVAEEIEGWIGEGIGFDEVLARARREFENRVDGGSLGFNRRGELPAAWDDVAWELDTGEWSGVVEADGHFTLLHVASERRTPLETLRPVIVRELREQARNARRQAIDSQLLLDTRFTPDSTMIAYVASRFAAHRDSLAAAGRPRGGLPSFSSEELSKPLFTVMNQPFTLEAFLGEIGQFDTSAWAPGTEDDRLFEILRRRAVSVGIQQVAAGRGIYQRPEIQARLERKREEFVMNGLLRQVWSEARVSEDELRERLRASGEVMPGEEAIRRLHEEMNREAQAARLQEFVDEIVARHDVQLYPERFPEVLERFEEERLEASAES